MGWGVRSRGGIGWQICNYCAFCIYTWIYSIWRVFRKSHLNPNASCIANEWVPQNDHRHEDYELRATNGKWEMMKIFRYKKTFTSGCFYRNGNWISKILLTSGVSLPNIELFTITAIFQIYPGFEVISIRNGSAAIKDVSPQRKICSSETRKFLSSEVIESIASIRDESLKTI